jgi:hypothetical protein
MSDPKKREKHNPYIRTSPELGDGERGMVLDMDDNELLVLTDAIRAWRDEFQDYEGEGFSLSVVWMTDAEAEALPEL